MPEDPPEDLPAVAEAAEAEAEEAEEEAKTWLH